MGLFGRDDRPSPHSPSTTPAATPRDGGRPPAQVQAKMTLLSRASSFEGAITGSGDVTVEGELQGSASISGRLTIAGSGTAKAALHGKTVLVAGKVEGNVTADEKLELQASAKLHGNITAPRILIQEGAIFEGQVVMQGPKTGTSHGTRKPSNTPDSAKPPTPGPNKAS